MPTEATSHTHNTPTAITKASDINPDNIHEVVPTCKFDLDRVVLLYEVDPHIWVQIIPDLIDWTCDPNWPSSGCILPLLRSNPITIAAAIPYVSTILRKSGAPGTGFDERDEEHQHVLLTQFVSHIDISFQREMIDVLQAFRDGVTDQLENDWGFRESVDEILKGIECDDTSRESAGTANSI